MGQWGTYPADILIFTALTYKVGELKRSNSPDHRFRPSNNENSLKFDVVFILQSAAHGDIVMGFIDQ